MASDLQVLKDSIYLRLEQMEKQLSVFKNAVESCVVEAKSDIQKDLCALFSRVEEFNIILKDIEVRVDSIEREKKSLDMIISGVPANLNITPSDIFTKICDSIGYNLSNHTVQCVFGVSSKRSKQSNISLPIIVRFSRQEFKSGFFKTYKTYGNLTLKDIGQTTDIRLYCNDGLSRRNSEIFREARLLVRQSKLAKVFTRFGSVFVIAEEGNDAVRVLNLVQLKRLLPPVKSYESTSSSSQQQQLHQKPQKQQQKQLPQKQRQQQQLQPQSSAKPISLTANPTQIERLVDNLFDEVIGSQTQTEQVRTRSKTGSSSSADRKEKRN